MPKLRRRRTRPAGLRDTLISRPELHHALRLQAEQQQADAMAQETKRSAALGIALAVVASLILALVAFEAVRAWNAPTTVTPPPSRVIGH